MTNLNTPSAPEDLGPTLALAKRQAMAKANRPRNFDEDIGSDPIAAALRQLHDAVADERLPDDLLRLLDEIDLKIATNKTTH